ncbi:hypothetical protein JCM11641_003100 [Rhodosporidiobolus odoratus]
MSTASSLQSEGNAHFAAKRWADAAASNRSATYLHMGKLDKALEDANAAVLKRPTWSKTYIRVAETQSRLQAFNLAEVAYKQAITYAEDATSKARYEASLTATKTSAATSVAAAKQGGLDFAPGTLDDHFTTKLRQQQTPIMPGECIITDEVGFVLSKGKDPRWPLPDKFGGIANFEKYFTIAIWHPRDISNDLDKRRARKGQQRIRQATSSLIRGRVVVAFALSAKGEHGSAIAQVKLGLGLLTEGAKKWAHLSPDVKIGARDAKTASAKRMFTLEAIETLAQECLEENDPEKWPRIEGSLERTSFYVKPRWEAYYALGWVHAQRAREPMQNYDIPSGQARMADLEEAKKAAEYYDKATKLMPIDFHRKREMMWHRLEMHLRAGGQDVRRLYLLAHQAEEVNRKLDAIFNPLNDFDHRTFARHQVQLIRDTLAAWPTDQASLDEIVKPMPTVNLRGTPAGFDPLSAFEPGYVEKLPGSLFIVHEIGR